MGARDDDHDDATSGQGRKASVLATTPGGTNVANTPYTHATPSPTVTRISGIGHHAWWHFGGDQRHKPTGAKAATVGATAAVTVVVVNATKFHGGRASTDLGDNDRATTVTISGTEQTGATAEGVTANIV